MESVLRNHATSSYNFLVQKGEQQFGALTVQRMMEEETTHRVKGRERKHTRQVVKNAISQAQIKSNTLRCTESRNVLKCVLKVFDPPPDHDDNLKYTPPYHYEAR